MNEATVVTDPNVLFGKPILAGTRISVEFILEELAAGTPNEQLIEAHPRLSADGIRAALAYAAKKNAMQVPIACSTGSSGPC